MKSFKEFVVWQKSVILCKKIYKETESFPKTEMYGLTSQMRRSSVSIPSNIAEGFRRGHQAEFIQFLRIAYGSTAELETQIIIAQDIGYLEDKKAQELNLLLEEIMKMLNTLITNKLRTKN
jgi:four helix bundle protein